MATLLRDSGDWNKFVLASSVAEVLGPPPAEYPRLVVAWIDRESLVPGYVYAKDVAAFLAVMPPVLILKSCPTAGGCNWSLEPAPGGKQG